MSLLSCIIPWFCFLSRIHSRRHETATPIRIAASPHGGGLVQQSQMVQPAGGSMGALYPQGVQQAAAQQPGTQGQQQILLARPQLQQQTHHINRPRKCRCMVVEWGARSFLASPLPGHRSPCLLSNMHFRSASWLFIYIYIYIFWVITSFVTMLYSV